VLAAAAVIWRLSYRDEEAGERAEGRALRFIGITFRALAAAVVFQAAYALATSEGASESRTGIALLTASFVIMPSVHWRSFAPPRSPTSPRWQPKRRKRSRARTGA
jgi:cellobiose-specific phosphotransferase system component IIC